MLCFLIASELKHENKVLENVLLLGFPSKTGSDSKPVAVLSFVGFFLLNN